jgi:sugar (pentulose or hexulose) kinase
VAGTTDGCAAQIASGALAPGIWSSALGTTLTVKGVAESLLHDPSGAVYCHRHPDGGWLPGGASNTGTSALAAAFPGADLDDLTARAAGVLDAVAAWGPLYPVAGTGERFPFDAPDARALLPEGRIAAASDPDAARFAAICLGVALVERLSFDVLAGLGAARPASVVLTGGASANRWWNQLRADVLGVPVSLPASAQAAVGMAVLAAAPPGALAATAARMVRTARRFEPDAVRHAALTPAYDATTSALRDAGWLDAAAVTGVGS